MNHRIKVTLPPELLEALKVYQHEQQLDSLAAAVVSATAKGLNLDVEPVSWGGQRPGAGRKKAE